jgi:predicted component of type VI protein secretion system
VREANQSAETEVRRLEKRLARLRAQITKTTSDKKRLALAIDALIVRERLKVLRREKK